MGERAEGRGGVRVREGEGGGEGEDARMARGRGVVHRGEGDVGGTCRLRCVGWMGDEVEGKRERERERG